ncbi:response regulator transcription factor [Ketobacter sp.]|uniref:response regulator transcription factor n=1 Tax=Ketobacter sp. TaxID=2083498 RepID=UPI000F26182C|nr:response regulator [Ketobacter sp.]RLT92791.1 MAG: response regulator [Ketobacter sp.]
MTIACNKILISHIGLTGRDQKFIQNIFRLSAQQLSKFRFAEEGSLEQAQIVLVNADDEQSISHWQSLKFKNKTAQGIFIGSEPEQRAVNPLLSRPLVLKKFVQALDQAAKKLPEQWQEHLQVLVVDDSLPIRKFLNLRLPNLCESLMDMAFAETGEQAVALMSERRFDMVFLDIVLPGMDGYQVCRQLKAIAPVFVVMLTSNSSPFDRIRGNMAGCDAYLTKPPTDAQLSDVFERMVSRARKAV